MTTVDYFLKAIRKGFAVRQLVAVTIHHEALAFPRHPVVPFNYLMRQEVFLYLYA